MAIYDSALYPHYGIRQLREQSGQRWADLVEFISSLPKSHEQVMAFALTMRRLRREQHMDHTLAHDPFAAMDAAAILRMFKGSETDLLKLYYRNLDDLRASKGSMRFRQTRAATAIA